MLGGNFLSLRARWIVILLQGLDAGRLHTSLTSLGRSRISCGAVCEVTAVCSAVIERPSDWKLPAITSFLLYCKIITRFVYTLFIVFYSWGWDFNLEPDASQARAPSLRHACTLTHVETLNNKSKGNVNKMNSFFFLQNPRSDDDCWDLGGVILFTYFYSFNFLINIWLDHFFPSLSFLQLLPCLLAIPSQTDDCCCCYIHIETHKYIDTSCWVCLAWLVCIWFQGWVLCTG